MNTFYVKETRRNFRTDNFVFEKILELSILSNREASSIEVVYVKCFYR
jgi:hypothetical protein